MESLTNIPIFYDPIINAPGNIEMREDYWIAKDKGNRPEFQLHVVSSRYTKRIEILDVRGRACLTLVYDLPHKPVQEYLPGEVRLLGVGYKATCRLDNAMPRGEHGTVRMLRVALHFASIHFPQLSMVTFLDDSHITCDLDTTLLPPRYSHVSREISLWAFDLLLNGQTWYEKNLGAKPLFQDLNIPLDTCRNATLKETVEAFEFVWSSLFVSYGELQKQLAFKNATKIAKNVYSIGVPWRTVLSDWFGKHGKVARELGERTACTLFILAAPALQVRFSLPDFQDSNMWRIDRATIDSFHDTVSFEQLQIRTAFNAEANSKLKFELWGSGRKRTRKSYKVRSRKIVEKKKGKTRKAEH